MSTSRNCCTRVQEPVRELLLCDRFSFDWVKSGGCDDDSAEKEMCESLLAFRLRSLAAPWFPMVLIIIMNQVVDCGPESRSAGGGGGVNREVDLNPSCRPNGYFVSFVVTPISWPRRFWKWVVYFADWANDLRCCSIKIEAHVRRHRGCSTKQTRPPKNATH